MPNDMIKIKHFKIKKKRQLFISKCKEKEHGQSSAPINKYYLLTCTV